MLRFTQGNLLDASAEALVNTVNEVGVMGKGIALMFRERFPENAKVYEAAAKNKLIHVGHVFATPTGELFPSWIIHFPTKRHWRNPSRIEWVHMGLVDLVRVIRELNIRSIALPPLGCGNGGLDWREVRPIIEAALSDLSDVDIIVFEPVAAYQNVPKRSGTEQLTPARALIAELVRRYSVLGLDCTILEIQKLAYFLRSYITRFELDDPLELDFSADKFGPYADRLRHLLDNLDGSYLHAEKRLSDAGPLDLIWFEETKRGAVDSYLSSDEASRFLPALEATAALIDGFESPLGMELLATVDWLEHMGIEPNVKAIRQALAHWPAGKAAAHRKMHLFDERLIDMALSRLAAMA